MLPETVNAIDFLSDILSDCKIEADGVLRNLNHYIQKIPDNEFQALPDSGNILMAIHHLKLVSANIAAIKIPTLIAPDNYLITNKADANELH